MPNLIIEAVDSSKTSVATGIDTVTRTIGDALGGQVVFSFLLSTTLTRQRTQPATG